MLDNNISPLLINAKFDINGNKVHIICWNCIDNSLDRSEI